MDFWHIILLAILQGLTEFLPISSAAHLILLPKLAGWDDQGLAFDVAVHVGTLVAVIAYFRREITAMTHAWVASLSRRTHTPDSRLAWGVLIGTIPVGLMGLVFSGVVEHYARSTTVIGITTIAFGLLLWWADRNGRRTRDEYAMSIRDALLIGVAQAIALIPGTSRSGITLTAGLMLGLTRQAAARFSFLLSIPVIVLAGGLQAIEVYEVGSPVSWSGMAIGAAVSGVVAYWTIHFFLRLLDRIGMLPFVIYRLFLGVVLLLVY